ncbi:MAG: mannose-1-phosphate guanylyltransferase [Gemmataceae bacterium]
MLHALIMAGGGGTRFWPRSRAAKPKQFLALAGDRTLLQQACDRLEAQVSPENTWIFTAEPHRAEAARELPQLPATQVVGEPAGRDTAPCIGLAAAVIHRRDPNAVMLVTPADHVIEPAQEFRRALQAAALTAEEHPDALVTFGIPPSFPATGYGYIHRGAEVAQRQGVPIYAVNGFREKPGFDLAEQFVAAGDYFWNAGIFVWKTTAILHELQEQRPELAAAVGRIADVWDTPRREEVLRREYPVAEKISIDYAVMEKARKVLVLRAPYKWDDVGSWLALERMHPQDADGNTVLATHAGLNTTHCVVVGDPGKLITTIGVSNLLIIQDGDALLVADRREEGTVKDLVERLKQKGLTKFL